MLQPHHMTSPAAQSIHTLAKPCVYNVLLNFSILPPSPIAVRKH
jgi:hypothetical protein